MICRRSQDARRTLTYSRRSFPRGAEGAPGQPEKSIFGRKTGRAAENVFARESVPSLFKEKEKEEEEDTLRLGLSRSTAPWRGA
jgi:hypothetical protein